ncbi:MAG: anthranilate phosphoribosyltransferase [Planctomycetota bacterium]|nr:anthranilate phosphoribosyltransferase [Planctomycetota bacterium]
MEPSREPTNLQDTLRALLAGRRLSREEARATFSSALDESADPVVFGGILTALAQRRETPDEIAGVADALRGAMLPFEHDAPDAIDTCGTGGDGLGTFNLSTAAALVACAAGARVLKHGNRSLSSRCGSADLLEQAGLPLELTPEAARATFEEVGITFLFAPAYHPAMRFAAPVRRALGVRTVFNYVGPLCNPGRVRRQLLGVSDADRLGDFAVVLQGLEHERAYVVHGGGGADELTLEDENRVASVGDVPPESFAPADLGLVQSPVSNLAGGDAARNLELLQGVLAGETGPLRDAVLLNTSAALVVADVASDAREGVERAREALDSGAARGKLTAWVDTARKLAGADS